MLKLVLIGLGVVLVAGLVSVVMWRIISDRRLYLFSAGQKFKNLGDFKDSKEKVIEVDKARTRLLWYAIVITAIIALLVLSYFLIARIYFIKHHKHKYVDSVKIASTCITEGTRGFKCKYCDEYYEEPIATIDHKYEESGRQEPTCVQEGFITYTCKVCNVSYNEPIKTVEHIYSEKERKEANCSNTGFIKYTCDVCGNENIEESPINSNNHQYHMQSFSKTSFWKNGYNHFVCEFCGIQCYSLKVNSFNWICLLAIIIIIIAIIIIIDVAENKYSYESVTEKPWFWIATVFAVLSIAFLVFHFVWVEPNQEECGHWYDKFSNAPKETELIEISRSESTYTQNGTITYKDSNEREYTEYLSKKEIVAKDIPQYAEKQYTGISEREGNNTIRRATSVPLFSKVTGRLASKNDKADYYRFTVTVPSNMHFVFTHDADNIYSYYWYATIYATDGKTVLNEGPIPNQDKYEFGASDLQPGTYYLRITAPSGGNPLMNGFTDANYYIVFTPECMEHTSQTQYFTKTASCSEAGEIVTVCDNCGKIINTEKIDSLGHKWSEWNVEKEASILQLGQKSRTCFECGEKETKSILTYVWLVAFIIVCLATLSLLLLFGRKYEGYKIVLSAICIYCLVVFPLIYFAFSKYPLCGSIIAGACILISIIPMVSAKKDREPGWVTFAIVIMVVCLIVGSLFAFMYSRNKPENIEIESTIQSAPDNTGEKNTTETMGKNDNSPSSTAMNTSTKQNEAKPASQGGKPSSGEEVVKSSQGVQSTTQSSKEQKSSTVTPKIQKQTDPTKKSKTTSPSKDTSQTQPRGIYIGGLDDPIIPDIIIPGVDGQSNILPVEEPSESLPEIHIQEQEDPTKDIVIVSP